MNEGRPRSGPLVLVSVENEGWTALLGADPGAPVEAAAVAALGRLLPHADTELSVTLADNDAVQALNAQWRGRNRPTNILSFPMRDLRPGEAPGPLLGDLVLAHETIAREAGDENKRPVDHVRHLVVHGVLHCLGYNHASEPDAEAMERLETLILADLGVGDPYAPEAGGAGETKQEFS